MVDLIVVSNQHLLDFTMTCSLVPSLPLASCLSPIFFLLPVVSFVFSSALLSLSILGQMLGSAFFTHSFKAMHASAKGNHGSIPSVLICVF